MYANYALRKISTQKILTTCKATCSLFRGEQLVLLFNQCISITSDNPIYSAEYKHVKMPYCWPSETAEHDLKDQVN